MKYKNLTPPIILTFDELFVLFCCIMNWYSQFWKVQIKAQGMEILDFFPSQAKVRNFFFQVASNLLGDFIFGLMICNSPSREVKRGPRSLKNTNAKKFLN